MHARQRPRVPTRRFRVDQPLRSGWAGKEKTRTAIAQAADIVRLCDASGGEALWCDHLNYHELCGPPTPGGPERTEAEKTPRQHPARLTAAGRRCSGGRRRAP